MHKDGVVGAFWHSEDDGVQCELCPHRCSLRDGERGVCHVRMCKAGELIATGYGVVSSVHVDPIEKKPLYHYLPGTQVLSIGGWGCNLRCQWCQNWQISQSPPPYMGGDALLPAEVCALAEESGSPAVAYTYNEPLINIEYVRDCAQLCAAAEVGTILVTNGFVNPDPLQVLLGLGVVDAVNLDLKSMSETFYQTWCHGRLSTVLETARACRDAGVHLELTSLLIPGENDTARDIESLCSWIGRELGRDVPLHLSAFFPAYRMDRAATPQSTMVAAFEIASAVLQYVYLGNVRMGIGQDTLCPGCGHTLIERVGYNTVPSGIHGDGSCATCGRHVDIVLPSI